MVYGDVTDGDTGNWQAYCIDTVNFVYAFAGHAVLSVANGNTVKVYQDDVLVASGYTFDESNDYESQGIIATITFTTDQGNATITVSGCGIASGSVLLENGIDLINDLLITRAGFSSAIFDATAKATARSIFDSQGYFAAGVITQDVKIWDLIQQMLGSFLGSAWISGAGTLIIRIDDGTLRHVAAEPIPPAEVEGVTAELSIDDLINACPCSYGYDYVKNEYRHHTDDTDAADIASQEIYGVRKPAEPKQFPWCRNLNSVAAVQAIVVAKLSQPTWRLEFTDRTMKRLHLDTGDAAILSLPMLYDRLTGQTQLNQYYLLHSQKPDFSKGKIAFAAIDTGVFMTIGWKGDGTVLGDGSRKGGMDRDTTRY